MALLQQIQWNGKTGGISFFRVVDILLNNGEITTSEIGYRGGDGSGKSVSFRWMEREKGPYSVPEGAAYNGQSYYSNIDESIMGAGGGSDDYWGGGNGASHGTFADYGYSNNGTRDTIGTKILSKIYLGPGGGSGGLDNNYSNPVRRKGGNGGGILKIVANRIINNQTISSNGQKGENYYNYYVHGGGGGAGGTVWITANILENNSDISASYGPGGFGNDGNDHSGSYYGGRGGNGRIRIDAITNEFFGSISPEPG